MDSDLTKKQGHSSDLNDKKINKIADNVSKSLIKMGFEDSDIISSDTIRGLVATELYKIGESDVARTTEIVGLRNIEINRIWGSSAFADNANLNSACPETMHKYLADGVSKKAALNLFNDEVRDAHLKGRCHVHDLEYFATRPFCLPASQRIIMKDRIDDSINIISITEIPTIPGSSEHNDKITYSMVDKSRYEALTFYGWRGITGVSTKLFSGKLVKITTTDGISVTVTRDHYIPTVHYGIQQAYIISPGFMIYCATGDMLGKELCFDEVEVIRSEYIDSCDEFVYDISLEGEDDTSWYHCFAVENGIMVHNCSEHDLRYYLYYGLYADGSGDTIPVATPAKDPTVAVLHAAKALGSASSNFAGGQGYQNFLTFLSPYFEGLSYNDIKQLAQCYIWEMSQMMNARGGQAVFSTSQLTPGVPDILKNVPIVKSGKIYDGKQAPLRTYGEFEREVRLAFKAYTEIMTEGDAFGRPFSFPKYEIELLPEHWINDSWDIPLSSDIPSYKDLWLDMCKLIAKDGTPYIHNSLDVKKNAISCYSCCSYSFQSDVEQDPDFEDKLSFKDGQHFILGSLQVGTINLPQAAYAANGSFDDFVKYNIETIKYLVEIFNIKKECLARQPLPFARQTPIDPNDNSKRAPPLWDEKDLPYAIGIVGLNEAVQCLTGKQIHESEDAHKMAVKILTYLQIEVSKAAKESNLKISFARTPAETTAQRFAVCDLLNGYSDIAKNYIKGDIKYAIDHLTETKDLPIYYTNGAMIEDGSDVSLLDKILLEEHGFAAFDGGNIFHIFLGEKNPNPNAILDFISKIVKSNIKYFTFTKDYTICKNCNNMESGLREKCTKCASDDVTQFSRVTGYIQAVKGKRVSGWNKGKISELNNRTHYHIGQTQYQEQ